MCLGGRLIFVSRYQLNICAGFCLISNPSSCHVIPWFLNSRRPYENLWPETIYQWCIITFSSFVSFTIDLYFRMVTSPILLPLLFKTTDKISISFLSVPDIFSAFRGGPLMSARRCFVYYLHDFSLSQCLSEYNFSSLISRRSIGQTLLLMSRW